MAALVGVERGDAHQPVHPALGLQVAVGIFAAHLQRGGFNAHFLAFLNIHDFRFEPVAFAPALVHAQEHIGPVTRLRAARARVDHQEAIGAVLRAIEVALQFEIFELGQQRIIFLLHLVRRRNLAGVVGFLQRELSQHLQVLNAGFQRLEWFEFTLDGRNFLDDGLRFFPVIPKILRGHARFQLGKPGLQFGQVKDTSASRPRGTSRRRCSEE